MTNETETTTDQPEAKFKLGKVSVTVWKNEGQNGPYDTFNPARTYEDKNGKLRNGTSFTLSEVPALIFTLIAAFLFRFKPVLLSVHSQSNNNQQD